MCDECVSDREKSDSVSVKDGLLLVKGHIVNIVLGKRDDRKGSVSVCNKSNLQTSELEVAKVNQNWIKWDNFDIKRQ